MKKILILLAFLPGVLVAQDEESTETSLKNKNGVTILPEAGDWGLSISAGTGLAFVGNIFSNTVNGNTLWWQFPTSPVTVITGKYFVSPDFAFRGGVNLRYFSQTTFFDIADDNGTGPDDYLEDKSMLQNSGITLLAGVEKRKGSTRVQGFYGGEFFVSFAQAGKSTFEYANAMTQANQSPSSTVFGATIPGPYPDNGYRLLESKIASSFTVGARGFIGVEVFLFPKLSLGGNFTWGVTYINNLQSSTTWEGWDPQRNEAVEYTLASKNGKQLSANIANAGGDLSLNFYF